MLDALLDLVLPARCAGCPAPSRLLCPGCRAALVAGPDLRVLPDGLVVALAGPYLGPARSALLAHKEHQRLGLAGPLGDALAVAVRALDPVGPLLLVPVPSARRVVRQRGHDATLRLARAAARAMGRTGRQVRTVRLLRQARAPADQAGLDASARARNLAGALRAGLVPPGHVVVLVDDVVTTGATLTEAARAVRAAGGRVCGAAVVAGTVLRRSYSA